MKNDSVAKKGKKGRKRKKKEVNLIIKSTDIDMQVYECGGGILKFFLVPFLNRKDRE